MTWLETIFGISPDGGNGSTEATIVLVAVLLVAAVIAWRLRSLRGRLHTPGR